MRPAYPTVADGALTKSNRLGESYEWRMRNPARRRRKAPQVDIEDWLGAAAAEKKPPTRSLSIC